MATELNEETIGCTFQWKIVNVSHCWLGKGQCMQSPEFTANALYGTKWRLLFYPMGDNNENKLEFYLRREDATGKKIFQVNYLLTFVDESGLILHEINGLPIQGFQQWSKGRFLDSQTRDSVFVNEKETFLPGDTLTVRCTLWEKEKKPDKVEHLYARTVYNVYRKSFLWKMEKFSTLTSGKKYNFKAAEYFHLEFFITEGLDFEKKIGLKFNNVSNLKYFSVKISVVDSAGNRKNFGTHEYSYGDLRQGVSCTLLFTKELMENKNHYLPNDVLTLECECVYSPGTAVNELCDFLMESPESTKNVVESLNECNEKGEFHNLSDLADDLKSIYNDDIFSDIKVLTSTQTFQVQKGILSARSTVFRTMFSSDMKENNSGYVDIDDFEDDTVHQMLLYIYTDSLGDLQFESASSLYKIADKYQILSLKRKCSFFLKENLSASNACGILILAYLHDDEELKSAVQDYIMGQSKEFFCSEEWKEFMKTRADIAADVMCKKIYQE